MSVFHIQVLWYFGNTLCKTSERIVINTTRNGTSDIYDLSLVIQVRNFVSLTFNNTKHLIWSHVMINVLDIACVLSPPWPGFDCHWLFFGWCPLWLVSNEDLVKLNDTLLCLHYLAHVLLQSSMLLFAYATDSRQLSK